MVPEFGHFGNKVWFSLFWTRPEFFIRELGEETYLILREVLPDSHLVISHDSFPCQVAFHQIASLQELRLLSQSVRDDLVLKICGANTMSARSY